MTLAPAERHLRRLATKARWRKNNPVKVAEASRKWHASRKAVSRAEHLFRKYGLTVERYNEMLSEQAGHCATCPRTPAEERHGVLTVDHDHEAPKGTGNRGLLCHHCNRLLGHARDNPAILRAAADYLER
jgi:hypothetical protein